MMDCLAILEKLIFAECFARAVPNRIIVGFQVIESQAGYCGGISCRIAKSPTSLSRERRALLCMATVSEKAHLSNCY
jgi:hypothetical protein